MRTTVVMAVCAEALLAGGAWAADTIRPGYWESVDTVGFPVATSKTDRRCITPKDVAKVMEGPSNHIYACDYPDHTAANGQISFQGTCVDKKGFRVGISGHGTYTPTTLVMTATVKIGPLAVVASTNAHRIGDQCPAPGAPK
jgi:hypothetical protein